MKIIILNLVVLLSVAIICFLFVNNNGGLVIAVEKTIKYSFEVKNTSSNPLLSQHIEVFAPSDHLHQKLVSIDANLPYTLVSHKQSNYLKVELGDLAPFARKQITVTAIVSMQNNISNFQMSGGDKLINSLIDEKNEDLNIISKKLSIEGKEVFPLQVMSWVAQNMTEISYTKAPKSTGDILKKPKGDCTEYSFLTTALLRSQGVDSVLVGGYVVAEQSRLLSARNYHNWSYYQSGSTWHLIDSLYQQHDAGYQDYIVFTTLKGDGSSYRFHSPNEHIEVRML